MLFADIQIFHVIKSAEDCKLLQSDRDSVQKSCIENYMKIGISEQIWFIILVKLTVSILIALSVICVKGLGVMLKSKLHFHRHVDCLHSEH
jgi:hypothetical protein